MAAGWMHADADSRMIFARRAARLLAGAVAVALLGAGVVLGWISVVAIRQHEGVFFPAGYAALTCMALGVFVLRRVARWSSAQQEND